ncbi:hypothetical protein RUND412_010270 [Rhizina undulata]
MAEPQLAWIGLGNMGRGMARNIIAKGKLQKPLIVYNRTTKRSEDFKASLEDPDSVIFVDSVGAAVKDADIVFTSLSNDASVIEVMETAIATPGGVEGKLFVETSTVASYTTEAASNKIKDAGGEFVACPVFGAPAMADNGQLVVVLAGPSAAIDRVTPYCDGVIGRATIDMRDQPVGKATLMKVTGNTFILSMVETLAEGHVFAEKSGLGTDYLHKFIETMLPGPYAGYSKRMITGDYIREDPLFAVDLAIKDANHGINQAAEVGVDMKITKVVRNHLLDLKSEAGPTGDMPGIYGIVRKESGLKYDVREE